MLACNIDWVGLVGAGPFMIENDTHLEILLYCKYSIDNDLKQTYVHFIHI